MADLFDLRAPAECLPAHSQETILIRRSWPLVLLCVGLAIAPVLTGCNDQSPQIPKDAFQKKPMPPEAEKGMREAMQHAGKPQTGH